MVDFLIASGNILFLLVLGAVLLLHMISLPANWIFLALSTLYAFLTGFASVGLWSLLVIAILAILGELLEFLVGVGYTAKRGATRWGVIGTFVGGIAGGVLLSSVAPPFGALLCAFGGSFAGAVLLEYLAQERVGVALRSGRAAFLGKVFGAVAKSMCGFWMWAVLAWQILRPGN
jgi:uncharacterized protein YqgC (DUF456 family)